MERNTRRRSMNSEQKKLLIEFVKKHKKLQAPKFDATFSYKDSQRLWEEISGILNSVPGAKKNWKLWRKTWQDLRSKTKKMKVQVNRGRNTRVSGPLTYSLSLKPAEEHINNLILKTEACGDMHTKESLVSFEFEKETENPSNIVDYLLETENFVHCSSDVPDGDVNNRINDIQSSKEETEEKKTTLAGNKNKNTSKQKTPNNKFSVPACQLEKSTTEARNLVNVSERTYVLKKWYYQKKVNMYQELNNTMVRIANALENKLGVSLQHERCKETLLDQASEEILLPEGSQENLLTENSDASFEEVDYLDESFSN